MNRTSSPLYILFQRKKEEREKREMTALSHCIVLHSRRVQCQRCICWQNLFLSDRLSPKVTIKVTTSGHTRVGLVSTTDSEKIDKQLYNGEHVAGAQRQPLPCRSGHPLLHVPRLLIAYQRATRLRVQWSRPQTQCSFSIYIGGWHVTHIAQRRLLGAQSWIQHCNLRLR